ncbi:transmembrane protein, putative (macronuclear) [Tetrahymena thermophila SB210]|uniref:Transmembrane protein, putative n=1 Tax=Tetrahymena thermophila (strain SB210) TaxID=312017 RepID=W7XD38_TETTS|nr:transmembrane protein, putative [Tetrahymena thermophila SB210]EWS75402.1 transmembrane protein, putative [Tetrahymena thermophila SB210]|eukprot:XP_012652076.1 transmembrane protein, putative [Tetrahymena thermophila SB210]
MVNFTITKQRNVNSVHQIVKFAMNLIVASSAWLIINLIHQNNACASRVNILIMKQNLAQIVINHAKLANKLLKYVLLAKNFNFQIL